MSRPQAIRICDATIQPGEVAHLAMPLPELYSCSPMVMPIKVIHSRRPGPCLLVFSGCLGNELNGLEIANRLHAMLDVKALAGTLITVPVVNVYGLIHYPKVLPVGGRRLTDCFPGDEQGRYGERVAALLTEEIFKKVDYCIELQTGGVNHNILPQVYCQVRAQRTRQLARAFQAPVVTDVTLQGNRLRQTTEELQVPLLVYQAGEAMRFDENVIQLGVDGVCNVMGELGMLSGRASPDIDPIFSRDEEWLLAHKGGIMHPKVTLGQTLSKNELLAIISDPFGVDDVEPMHAPQEGVVVGINTTPLVHEGLPLFKIASFLDYEKAESVIEAWDQSQPDSYIGS